MFVVGGLVGSGVQAREEAWFFKGYGPVEIDPLALAYYRYEWVVQEFSDYGERVFFTPEVGDETRQDAVEGFRQLFQSGDVVEAAYGAEVALPAEFRAI